MRQFSLVEFEQFEGTIYARTVDGRLAQLVINFEEEEPTFDDLEDEMREDDFEIDFPDDLAA